VTIAELIKQENRRQQETISLIASENYVPKEVREAAGSVLMNKYAEGYPGRRYYGGNEVIDKIENEAIAAVKKLFGAGHANVKSYSGKCIGRALDFFQKTETLSGKRILLQDLDRIPFNLRNVDPRIAFVDALEGVADRLISGKKDRC